MRFKLNSLFLVITMAAQASAYDLQPSWIAGVIVDPVHEMLSIASVKCQEAMSKTSSSIDDWNCLPEYKDFATDYSNDRWAAIIRGKVGKHDLPGLEMKYLLAGVRWPDDPIGTLRSNLPAQWGVHYRKCTNWINDRYKFCANRFCLSHFGHLQMAHSMEPSAPWCQDRDPDSRTCEIPRMGTNRAIEEWVRWLVPVGKGEVGPDRRVLEKDYARALFDMNCGDVYLEHFSYKSLFFIDCSKTQWEKIFKLWTWGMCKSNAPKNSEQLSAQLKARAIGAILHLIQDSYARGHTLRIKTSGSWCSSHISCTKITKFSDYTDQDPDKHRGADETPDWDGSCLKEKREVDDPITAGAKVLAKFKNGSSADDIWKYLAKRVFLETDPAAGTDQLVLKKEKEKEDEAIKKDKVCFGK